MCLLSVQRSQTKLMKQSNFHPAPLEFRSFPEIQNIYVVECVNDYLERTDRLRKEGRKGGFFISYATTPHKTITSRSISRYVCKFLEMKWE